MDTIPSNSPPMDPMLERAKKLADAAEEREREAANTKERLLQERKKQDQNLTDIETLARSGKEVEDTKEGIALNATKLMLLQPDEVASFLDNAERQANRYERFKANKDAAFSALPQTDGNKKNMESIVKNAQDSYAAFYEGYAAIPNTGPWKLNTDEAHAANWKKMAIGVKALELNLDAFDKLTGNYADTAKLFIPEANRYASAKKEDAEWKKNIDKGFKESWEKRAAFFNAHPDPSKDTEELKAIRTLLVDAEKQFDTHQPAFKTNELARGTTFLAMHQMAEALSMYETYKELQKLFPAETAVASSTPSSGNEAGGQKEPAAVNKPGTEGDKEIIADSDILTATQGNVLPTGESDGIPSYIIGQGHPLFDIATNRRDIDYKPLNNGSHIELGITDWETLGGNPNGKRDGSWSKKKLKPEGKPLPSKMTLEEKLAAQPQQPAIVEEQPVAQEKPAPTQETKPAAEEKKNEVATQQPVVQPENKPAQQPVVAEMKPAPAQETKPNDTPIVEQKPVVNIPPKQVEQPLVAAEKGTERVRAVLKQDGSINVPTQETIYIAYYLPNGERQRNYVRFPATDIGRWSIDGMCTAERTADGWTVRPETGLPGALLFNVGGSTSIIRLPENAPAGASPRPSERKEEAIDPDFPILSRISGGK